MSVPTKSYYIQEVCDSFKQIETLQRSSDILRSTLKCACILKSALQCTYILTHQLQMYVSNVRLNHLCYETP